MQKNLKYKNMQILNVCLSLEYQVICVSVYIYIYILHMQKNLKYKNM